MQRFPLTIQGTDLAAGLEFHYQYDVSSQTVMKIPERTSIVLAALGLAVLAVTAMARGGRLRQ